MRIYAILENVGSEYYTEAPVKISLTPFNEECSFLDLEEGQTYETVWDEGGEESDWRPYNSIHRIHTWYNPKTNEYDSDESVWDEEDALIEGEMCQKYENGIPVGKPYFEEY